MKAIIGRKVGMSQIFDEKGHVIPVTVIEAGPCVVTQKKTSEKDGYEAVQLGYEDIREAKLSKPELGHLNKAGVSPKKYLREFDLDNASELELGAIIKADTFKSGDFVDVTGTSKGHGYTGVIKRWNASRGRMTHGGGPVHRHAGSMGSTTDPSRIFKGKIGPGQYGVETVTIQNLEVVKVDPELHKEILARYEQLHLSPYKGFINPVYTPVRDAEGNITDVKISYDEAYDHQMLRYSRDYNTLPDIND